MGATPSLQSSLSSTTSNLQSKAEDEGQEGNWHPEASQRVQRVGENHRHCQGRAGFTSTGCEEDVGLLEEEQPAGPGTEAVVHSRQDYAAHLRQGEDQVLQHVQVPEGAPDQPRVISNQRLILYNQLYSFWYFHDVNSSC